MLKKLNEITMATLERAKFNNNAEKFNNAEKLNNAKFFTERCGETQRAFRVNKMAPNLNTRHDYHCCFVGQINWA